MSDDYGNNPLDTSYQEYDHSRLGGDRGPSQSTPTFQPVQAQGSFHIETYNNVPSVHVFNDKLIIIDSGGSVMVIGRYDGQLRVA